MQHNRKLKFMEKCGKSIYECVTNYNSKEKYCSNVGIAITHPLFLDVTKRINRFNELQPSSNINDIVSIVNFIALE